MRIALGANRSAVMRLVVGHALRLALLGIALGMLVAYASSRAIGTLLFEASPSDPASYIGGSVIVLGVALLASYVPARRAVKLDPALALRHE